MKPKQTALERVHAHVLAANGDPVAVDALVSALVIPLATVRTAAIELVNRGHIARVILRLSCGRKGGDKVGYCLPGHPLIAETARLLAERDQRKQAESLRRGNKVLAAALRKRTELEQVWR